MSIRPAVCGPTAARSASRSTLPSRSVGISRTVKPHMVAVAGLVPCAASGTMISCARAVAARGVPRADHGDAGELALRAGHGREAHARHAGDVLQDLLQLEQAGEIALTGFGRRERMTRQELRQHRQAVAGPRVVLHGARAQRVELRVDGEVLLRQPRVVAHRVQLGDLGQQRQVAAQQVGGKVGRARGRRSVLATAAAVPGQVEDERHARAMLEAGESRRGAQTGRLDRATGLLDAHFSAARQLRSWARWRSRHQLRVQDAVALVQHHDRARGQTLERTADDIHAVDAGESRASRNVDSVTTLFSPSAPQNRDIANGRSADTTSTTALGTAAGPLVEHAGGFLAGGRVQAGHDVEHLALAGEAVQGHVLQVLVDQREVAGVRASFRAADRPRERDCLSGSHSSFWVSCR